MELRRILNRKTFLFWFVAVIVTLAYYLYLRQESKTITDGNGDELVITVKEYCSKYIKYNNEFIKADNALSVAQDKLSEIETMEALSGIFFNSKDPYSEIKAMGFDEKDVDIFIKKYNDNPDFSYTNEWKIEKYIITELARNYRECCEYSERINEVLENCKRLKKMSSVIKNDSFAYRNVVATEKAYTSLQKIRLEPDNTVAVESVQNMKFLPYFVLTLCMIFPIMFLEERKKGLWGLINQTEGGRSSLALKRVIICMLGSIVLSFSINLALYTESFILNGGINCLSKPYQLLTDSRNSVFEMTILQGIVLESLLMGVAAGIIVLLAWFLLSVIREQVFGYVILLAILVSSHLIYNKVSAQSSIMALKYSNPAALLNLHATLSEYRNVSFFGFAVFLPVYELIISALFLIIVLWANVILSEKMKPESGTGKITGLVNRIICLKEKLVAGLSFWGKEAYFQLFVKKTVCIFIVGMMLTASLKIYSGIEKNKMNLYLDDIYEKYTECLTDKEKRNLKEQIDEIGNEVAEAERNFETAKEKYSAGEINIDEAFEYYSMLDDMKIKRAVYSNLSERYAKLTELDNKGYGTWFVDERGYKLYFSEKNEKHLENLALIVVVGIMIMCSLLYDSENKNRVDMIIRPSSGRKRYAIMKKCILIVEAVTFAGIIFTWDFINEKNTFSLKCFSAPAKHLGMFSNINCKVSIGTIFFLMIAYKTILAGIISVPALELVKKRKLLAALLLLSLFLLPHIFGVIGFSGFERLDIVRLFTIWERSGGLY